ncbi:nucleic acid-binding protein [Meredithblackwellia eburnea MCA 4105]
MATRTIYQQIARQTLQKHQQQVPRLCNCRTFASSTNSPVASSSATLSSPPTPTVPTPGPSKYYLPKGLVMTGIVTSAGKMRQTATVTVEHRRTHTKTLKEFNVHHKFLVHDPTETTVVGDRVSIRNCRPVSRRKRFELVEVLQGARERTESLAAQAGEGDKVAGAGTGNEEGVAAKL